MRAVPTAAVAMPTPTPAISKASARGRLPCIHSKVTSTLRVFCSMKTISTTSSSADAQMPSQMVLMREEGIRPADDASGVRSGACGAAGGAESAFSGLVGI